MILYWFIYSLQIIRQIFISELTLFWFEKGELHFHDKTSHKKRQRADFLKPERGFFSEKSCCCSLWKILFQKPFVCTSLHDFTFQSRVKEFYPYFSFSRNVYYFSVKLSTNQNDEFMYRISWLPYFPMIRNSKHAYKWNMLFQNFY